MSYDGKPADYQLARIDALGRELGDVKQSFAKLREGELVKVNAALKAKNAPRDRRAGRGDGGKPAFVGRRKDEENEVQPPFERD